MKAAAKKAAPKVAKIPASKLQYIEVSKLQIAPDNIRKSKASKQDDLELKASIKAIGVVQPLIVKPTPKGKFYVYAGSRRLEQTQALIKEKVLSQNHHLACVVVDRNANTTEISIIENTMQIKMHPVDEFEAYSKLHLVDRLSVEEIALHSGRSTQSIYQALALGNVHPQLRNLCRDGTLDVGVLSAYASTSDQKKQLEVYNSLKRKGGSAHNNKETVRSLINKEHYKSTDKLAKFIGVANYELRGGETTSDLFQQVKYLHSTPLVEQLVKEKLQNEVDRLSKEWKWAEVNLEFSEFRRNPYEKQNCKKTVSDADKKSIKKLETRANQLNAELSKLDDLEYDPDLSEAQRDANEIRCAELRDQIEEIADSIALINSNSEHYSENQRATAGCIVSITDSGQLAVFKGLVRKEDKPKPKSTKAGSHGASGAGTDDAKEDHTVSAALAQDLSAYHLAAAKAELLYNIELMYQAVLFSVCWEVFSDIRDGYCDEEALHITPRTQFKESSNSDIENSRMNKEIEEQGAKLNLTWLKDTVAESFPLFQKLSEQDIKRLTAYAGTVTVRAKAFGAAVSDDEPPPFIDLLLQQANARLAKHWRPTTENFFSKCPRPMLEAAGTAMLGENFLAETRKQKRTVVNGMLGGQTAHDKVSHQACWMPPGFLYHDIKAEVKP